MYESISDWFCEMHACNALGIPLDLNLESWNLKFDATPHILLDLKNKILASRDRRRSITLYNYIIAYIFGSYNH